MLRYYGVDLVDVVSGKVAPRRALALLRGMPDDSLSVAAWRRHHARNHPRTDTRPVKRDPTDFRGWSATNTWLALMVEQLVSLHFALSRLGGGRPGKAPKLDIPGRDSGRRTHNLAALARAHIDLNRGTHGGRH